jgi:hypothetical protein
MRGGRKPNGRIGTPRRGERSREHRLERVPNGPRCEYGLSVGATLCSRRLNAWRRLLQTAFHGPGRPVMGALCRPPVSGLQPLARLPNHLGGAGLELMQETIVGVARATMAEVGQ